MSAEHTNASLEKDFGPAATGGSSDGFNGNGAPMTHQLTAEETAKAAARFGYGPLSHVNTTENQLRPFGGEFQPGLYKSVEQRKFANPAPLGLCAFALTTFVLSAINMGARDITEPNIVVALAFGYGGLVQLLAGMWEMAVGNTFGATALSSYGGFWLSFAIVLTPGGFNIQSALTEADEGSTVMFDNSFGLFLFGWFIFTTILLFCTLRSTVAFFLLFFFLDLTFLLLGIGYIHRNSEGKPNPPVIKTGGFFGLMAAFVAWYNALAGIADNSNSFFILPVAHFPWSPTARSRAKKTERETA
ncbi:Meiotically up-regulated protein 86 protein [Aspergillus melleus]|uniref:Meiotically up-regulated protein 86 protein n=1 Tax=Aspergillus melleus TaxID=138277 RepID=A0ACC3B5F9_9EURO|nr:Meiotically up-regulated protein 86 protein [Aspergillus melleus]